jgi:predicted Zn-dependent protease
MFSAVEAITLDRRQFIQLGGLTAAGWLVGCATNPVTGQSQLMLVSEQQEIDLDKQNSPHQFSADYGISQDHQLNTYLDQTGRRLAAVSHRPGMPYHFQMVNATYVNAYAFPGGSIAATRGILLKLNNEAELAALLGHELGHVNARHTAAIMSKGMLTNALIGGVTAVVGTNTGVGQLTSQLGMLGSGVLLASYSRDNERQADELGLNYMVKAGYGPDGMIGLMEMLNTLSKGHGSAAELLFATHPMSQERYRTAVKRVETLYGKARSQPVYRERYMDQIASLRRIGGAIESLQKGEEALGQEKWEAAEGHFSKALNQAPDDYTGLVLMAKCKLMQKQYDAADDYLKQAQSVYPQEAQAHYLAGYVDVRKKRYDAALSQFAVYDKTLPGNPTILFFKGLAYEGKGSEKTAAENFYRYLQQVQQGTNAQYAYNRLVQWGYLKPKQ